MRYNNIFRNKFKLKRLKCKIIIKRKVIPLKKRRYKWMQLNKNKKNMSKKSRNKKNNNYMRCILMQQNKLMNNNLKKIINQITNLQKKNLNKQMI